MAKSKGKDKAKDKLDKPSLINLNSLAIDGLIKAKNFPTKLLV